MEAMSLCEEEVYVELCRMEEPPALEEMRAAVNMRGHEWKPQTVSTFLIRLVKKGYVSTYRKGRYFYYQHPTAADHLLLPKRRQPDTQRFIYRK